jgi:hypothetical protein
LVEPLLGSRPKKAQVIERSNETVHEWYEVEIEKAVKKLGVNWIGNKALYFYMIPLTPAKEHTPLVSFDLGKLREYFQSILAWFKQRIAKVSG